MAGSPKLVLGAFDGGDITATSSDPCEINVDFGTLPVGQGASATIHVNNVGAVALDLSKINPSVNAEFGVNYGTQRPLQPGEFGQFTVTFEASSPGVVSSSFTILTDGLNLECPVGNDGALSLTVALTGSGN